MSKVEDGGPAHPIYAGAECIHEGVTLRDEFAMRVMQGMASNPELYFGTNAKPYNPWPWNAEQAYKAADAMLEARKK
jgi:hypothetical protein